jgi:glycosyltransferase involved in cell wall biosynthesis
LQTGPWHVAPTETYYGGLSSHTNLSQLRLKLETILGAPVKCLFVTHKWGDAVPGSGESVTVPHLIDTFGEWGKGEHKIIWTDECFNQAIDVTAIIRKTIQEFNPDIIAFTPIPAEALEAQNVPPDAMHSFGRKTVSFFFDLADEDARRLSEKYAAVSNLCVNIDGYGEKIGKQFLSLWPARTKRVTTPKSIDVSFVGARSNYSDRTAALALLADAQIPVVVSGGRAETRRSFDEYFDILDRSLITLNFSKTVRGVSQIKARVFEALSCGCCLVEDRNNVTARYFEPGVDYIAWDSIDELPRLINSLLKDRELTTRIGRNGKLKFEHKYSATCFWDTIARALEPRGVWATARSWLK